MVQRVRADRRLRRLEGFALALPHDFPKWKTVYHYFRQWRIDGDWQRIHEQLRQWVRAMEDRHPSPGAAQSRMAQIVVFDDWDANASALTVSQ